MRVISFICNRGEYCYAEVEAFNITFEPYEYEEDEVPEDVTYSNDHDDEYGDIVVTYLVSGSEHTWTQEENVHAVEAANLIRGIYNGLARKEFVVSFNAPEGIYLGG